jgi:hypothetical protein
MCLVGFRIVVIGWRVNHYENCCIKFRDGGDLSFRARCSLIDDHITSRFHLTGHVMSSDLISTEPLIESWEPNGPGGIRGHFTMSWRRSDGQFMTADASTNYQIDTTDEQTSILHRFINMKTVFNGNTLSKTQTVGLFSELPKNLWLANESDVKLLEEKLATR